MKLSDFKDEAALDLLADIIEPASEIMTDSAFAAAFKSENRPLIAAVRVALKSHKSAVIDILAAMEGVPRDEYTCNVLTLPVKLLEILNDEELQAVFRSAGQREAGTPSGSAMENTEAAEQ